MNSNMYSMNNFDFLARSFARMQAEGHPVDIQAITGNMDEEHRSWFSNAMRCTASRRRKPGS
ncbi:cell surface composition regulator GlgS [Citrobacter freundii]